MKGVAAVWVWGFSLALNIAIILFISPCMPFTLHTIVGTSMEPVITSNDMVVLMPVNDKDLQGGDIIAFRPHDSGDWNRPPIVHRIIAMDDSGRITTKGDNRDITDRYEILPSDVVGRTVLVLPYAGAVMRILTSVVGYVGFVVIPALLLIIGELRVIRGCRQ